MPNEFVTPGPERSAATLPSPDLLCFTHLRWTSGVTRPRILMTLAAAAHRVFYIEEPVWRRQGELADQFDGTPGVHLEVIQETASIWIVRPHITRGSDPLKSQTDLLTELINIFAITRYIVWYYTAAPFDLTLLRPVAAVYDSVDRGAGASVSTAMLEDEQLLMERADLIFTDGNSLAHRVEGSTSPAYPLPGPSAHALPSPESSTLTPQEASAWQPVWSAMRVHLERLLA